MKDLVEAHVAKIPNCDICRHLKAGKVTLAKYDFKTKLNGGQWAYGCEECYQQYRFFDELGMGKGQLLVLKEAK